MRDQRCGESSMECQYCAKGEELLAYPDGRIEPIGKWCSHPR